jgi:hypothetical protein
MWSAEDTSAIFPQLQTDMAHRHKVELELAAAGKTV